MRRPDHPLVTVEIAGAFRAGKSTIAHLLRAALAEHGIAVNGPARLPKIDVPKALAGLAARGLSVEVIETETAPRTQIEARGGMARRA